MVKPARFESAVPSVLVVGGTHTRLALPLTGIAATTILKGASAADVLPSLTLITMLANVPTLELVGVPLSEPIAMLKVAHEGMFWILKLSAPPDGSVTAGMKEKACPAVNCAAGVPAM